MKTWVYVGTSLDGFIARRNGDFDWLAQFANDEAVSSYEEFMANIDAIVIGRNTFEKVLTFASFPYKKNVFVLSNSLKQVPDSLTDKVAILAKQPSDILTELSKKNFSNIYVDGGNVIQNFLKENLIDNLIVSTVPVILGKGISLFGSLDVELHFDHVRTIIQSNGLVRNYYKKVRSDS